MNVSLRAEFEDLARAFLARHPTLRYEWHARTGVGLGVRTDLVFPVAGERTEIWASAYDAQIAVGSGEHHTDFEDWGRGWTDREVAQEALDYMVSLLLQNGRLEAPA